MKLIRSIKHRAILVFVSFTVGLTLLYLSLAVIAAFVVEDDLIYNVLKLEAQYVERSYAKTGQLPEPSLEFVQVYPSVESLPDFAQTALEQGTSDNEIFAPGDKHFHFQQLRLADGSTGYILAEVSPLLTVTKNPHIFETFLWGLILTMSIAIWLAYKISGLTVKPVMAMADAVKENQRLPKLDYELGYLSETMQQAFDDLSSTLKREKDFTTDVSHELRTPLTVLNNITTLAEQRGLSAQDIQRLKQVGDQMQHTVEILLALARKESIAKQAVNIRPLLEQTAMQCILASGVQLNVELTIPDSLKVESNQGLLQLLFANLINNALSHASSDQLHVTGSNEGLVFHNRSEQVLTADVFESGIKGESSNGIGQGLYLVTRIIDALGWRHQLIQSDKQFAIKITF